MLTVKTYVDKSLIPHAGNGCFAAEEIRKGDLIWEFNPFFDRVYTDKNIESMNVHERLFVHTYAYRHNGLYFLCVDNARFFNHSNEDFNTVDPIDEYRTYANRDIHLDEEILSDYGTFGTDKDKGFNLSL